MSKIPFPVLCINDEFVDDQKTSFIANDEKELTDCLQEWDDCAEDEIECWALYPILTRPDGTGMYLGEPIDGGKIKVRTTCTFEVKK